MEVDSHETTVPTVLVVGVPTEWVRSHVGDDVDLVAAASATAALERVTNRIVDCIVAGADIEDRSGIELIGAVRERAPDLPIVYAPETGSVEDARSATAAGATAYLPRASTADNELAERIDEVVAAYDRRRQADREREMFRSLLSDAPLSIYFKNEDARHVAASSQVTASMEESLLGTTDLEAYADEIGEEMARESYEEDLRVIETGEPIVGKEQRHVTDEGEVMWLRTTKLPWRNDDGEVVGLVGLTRIVTEGKERQLQLEREKRRLEQFASFASHDLRNPINLARGYVERAVNTGDEEHLDEVVDALDRMDRLIEDLLQIARPEDHDSPDEWVDLEAVARRAWTSVDHGRATLRLEVPEGVELLATSGGLRQVLENLFANAIDHGGTGVTVEVGVTDTGFYVADDGPGIDAEDPERVFEYGYTTGGTGVGLAIVAEVAEAHGWTPSVETSAAGGARFTFEHCILRPPDREEDEDVVAELIERTNVGGAQPVGDAERIGTGEWTVRAGGRNLWGSIDEYYAVHAPVEGDVRIECWVTDLEPIHAYSKAGLLIADAVEAGRPLGFVGSTVAHGAETAWRVDDARDVGTDQYEEWGEPPHRFRIDRIGDRVTCYAAEGRGEWTILDQRVLDLSDPVAVGIAACSHNERRTCEAAFEGVRIVGLEPLES